MGDIDYEPEECFFTVHYIKTMLSLVVKLNTAGC